MVVRPPEAEYAVTQISAMPIEDVRALGFAVVFIVAAACFVVIRSRLAPGARRPPDLRAPRRGRGPLFDEGRCRWRLDPEHHDGAFRAWSCRRCGARRWTLGVGNPPESCR